MKLENQVIKFKVAMDSEAAKNKEHKEVEINVSFENADEKKVVEMAMKAQVVAWQSQIRSHWDEFISDGLPKTVVFGEALWESSRGKVTVEKATNTLKAQLSDLSAEEKLVYLKECGLL